MKIKFKDGKLPKTSAARLKYLYRLQEQLRVFHNEKAKQIKDGKITLDEFRKFQKGWFAKRNNLICGKILECKQNLTNSEKKSLLEYDEESKSYGSVKEKERFKKDKSVKIDIEDIEEA